MLFADGARSWQSAAAQAGIHFSSVNHSLLQFAKRVPLPEDLQKPLKSKAASGDIITAGTQCLDRRWQDVK